MKVKGMTTTKATSSQEKGATLQQLLLECGKGPVAPPGSSRRYRQASRWRQPAQSMLYNLSKPETSTGARIILWLVVSTPLKNMKVNWDDHSQYMEK